ncbi:hypothetical protein LSAT2_022430 [Lamellibrachia satsuma]|nr:hypothetical protein LSAT2_022430 [Lamellibrachia satsuma]
MKLTEWLYHFLLLFAFGGVTAAMDYFPGQSCGESGQTVHISTDGTARCCMEHKCAKGTVGEMCNDTDPESSTCVPCPDNKFMATTSKSSDLLQCYLRRQCPSNRGLTIKINGTLVSDNVCKCDIERGYWDPRKENNPKTCWHEECAIGHELTEDGCKSCKPGMFKTNKSIEMCSHWTDCGAIGLSYGRGGNTSYNPGCVNNTIVFSTGESKQADNSKRYDTVVIVGGVMGGVVLCVLCILIIFFIFRRHHGEETDRQERPLNGVEAGSSQPYEAMNGVIGSQTYNKDPYDVICHEYEVPEEPDGRTDKDKTEAESVEEDAEPFEDDSKPSATQQNTPSVKVAANKDQPTVFHLRASTINVQLGDYNGMEINN